MPRPQILRKTFLAASVAAAGFTLLAFAQPLIWANGPGNGIGPGHGILPGPGIGVNGGIVNGRCGPGTRVPFLVISPWARVNYVSDARITQSSVVRFIEDNWLNGQRIGQGSNDATAGSIMDLFDFRHGQGRARPLYLDPETGTPIRKSRHI